MGRRKKSRDTSRAAAGSTSANIAMARRPVPKWKRWCFRLMAMVLAPVLLFGVLEISLRLFGFGYPTSFLLPAEANGRQVWIQNSRFGWRYFGKELAREPHSIFLD